MTLALISSALVLVAALGFRAHLLPLGPAFLLLAAGLLGSLAAVVVYGVRLALMLIRHQPGPQSARVAVAGLVLALVVLAIPGAVVVSGRRNARGLPPIHDISTDTDDPPAFVAVLPLRVNAANSAEYGGSKVAAQQRQAYPDLTTVMLAMPPDQAFDRALAAARDMGWELAGADRGQGRIEATDTTFWFGFKDDVVVRLRGQGGGTRVDVRSVSRVGGGDVGTNARRIRGYLTRLRAGSRG